MARTSGYFCWRGTKIPHYVRNDMLPLRQGSSNYRYSYGKYAWDNDATTPGNDVVENWFELMDACFDNNDQEGGVNRW